AGTFSLRTHHLPLFLSSIQWIRITLALHSFPTRRSSDLHDMGITRVIRGDDHLNNAFRQTQIYRALDWPIPEFAHVPLIHGADRSEEHTSELQSRGQLVCRPLLEKKNHLPACIV